MLGQQVMDKIRADEACAAGDEQLHEPAPEACCAVRCSRTRLLARQSDSNVPASVHQPSITLWESRPSARYELFTSVISYSFRPEGCRPRTRLKTVQS